MLDELLGRADLKARIAELEEENERLRARRDAEGERRADAVRDRQAAEERANRLEDRIAELEDRVERAGESEGEDALAFRGTEDLRGDRLASVLDRLASFDAGPEGALTAAVGEDGLPDAARDAFGERAPLLARAAPCVAVTDDAGVVSAALSPPLQPSPSARWRDGFDLDPSWFLPSGSFALAVVRSDLFALGEYEGRDRVAFEGFETDVMGEHDKGGFSQRRFERLREEQIANHLDRCREALAGRETDRCYVVGETSLLAEFRDVADAVAPADATGDPEDALGTGFADFWTTRLYRL